MAFETDLDLDQRPIPGPSPHEKGKKEEVDLRGLNSNSIDVAAPFVAAAVGRKERKRHKEGQKEATKRRKGSDKKEERKRQKEGRKEATKGRKEGSDKRKEGRKEATKGRKGSEESKLSRKADERGICDGQLINDNKRVLTFKCPSKDSRCCCC